MTAVANDNIVSGTSQPILVEDTGHATVTGKNNWLQTGASLTGLTGVTGSVFGSSPGFANAATYDFTLAAGSACIGAANTSVGNLPTAEYYENETVTRMYRMRATAMDLGAFEHTTTGPGIGPYGSDGGGIATAPDAGAADAAPFDATVTGSGDGAGATFGADGGEEGADAEPTGTGPGGATDGSIGSNGHTGSSGGCGCRVDRETTDAPFAATGLAGLAAAITIRRRRRWR
jgi:MYXO-CTERM domain-containing protein